MSHYKLYARLLTALLTIVSMACFAAQDATQDNKTDSGTTNHEKPKSSSILAYGNWCGPRHPRIINSTVEPIDRLDAACKRHDLCYVKKGDFACGCDEVLVHEIDNGLLKRQYYGKTLVIARSIKAHFSVSPCEGNTRDKMLPTRILTGIYQGTKKRVMDILNRIKGPLATNTQQPKPAPPPPNKEEKEKIEEEDPAKKLKPKPGEHLI